MNHNFEKSESRQSERGAVLLVVLFLTIALLGLGMTGLYLASNSLRMVTNINLSNEARVVAEAGIEHARAILFDRSRPLPLPALLAGSGIAADEVPSSTGRCLGEDRGAVLVDLQAATPTPLLSVAYPHISRRADLPSYASRDVSSTLGTYTVYIRQDLADCRMGNFACDFVPDAGASTYGSTSCSPPSGLPDPNRYVVVRSEGVAVDGVSKEVVEVTYYLGAGEPATSGGTGGSSGTGGSTSPGGGGSGMGGTGGSGGTGGAGGAGGTTGNTSPGPCMNYAVTAVAPCPNGWMPGCITINSSSLVDDFNSGAGPYGGSNRGAADVAMTCSRAAASSCPNNCPSGCITGTIAYGNTSSFSASTMPEPAYTANGNRVTVPADTILSPAMPTSVLYVEEIDVNTGGTLTLRSGRYVVDYLNLNQLGTLYIDDSQGPVVLWVLSSVSPSSTVTVKSGRAEDFWLVYNGTNSVNNNSSNSFNGVIFAPAAQVNLDYVVTGAVVGGSVTLNGTSRVHFDTMLRCP